MTVLLCISAIYLVACLVGEWRWRHRLDDYDQLPGDP